ncbi:MAG: hypothetical protein QMD50_00890 [Patescibacteria group bacterium]|nr:hypothetical protein [Patescibacteria group bacterium]
MENKKIKTFLIAGLASVVFSSVFATKVFAASFDFSPASGSYDSGARFSVVLSVNSEGVSINAAEGIISFPFRYLKVESVSTAGSIFKFWSQEPVFSNTEGTISFGGGLPSPGFTGSNGKVISINFKTVGEGQASFQLTSGAILANDGMGTNVLNSTRETLYKISATVLPMPQVILEDKPSEETLGLPSKPVISSKTHLDENKWYNSQLLEVSWVLSENVSGVSYAFVNNSNYSLLAVSKGLVSQTKYDLNKFKDGIWYFYARFRDSGGTWGPVARRVVKIDRTPPEVFSVTRGDNEDPTNPKPILQFSATDKVSGILNYLVKVGSKPWIDANTLKKDDQYVLPVQLPGNHFVVVKAYDLAGNYQESNLLIQITSLKKPVIKKYPSKFNPPQQSLYIEGEALPSTYDNLMEVLIFLRKGDRVVNFKTPVDEQGKWKGDFNSSLKNGDYELYSQLIDLRGALSEETERIKVRVGGWAEGVLKILGEYGTVIVGSILILGVIVVVFYFVYSRVLMFRRRFMHELKSFRSKLKSDIQHLEKDLDETASGTVDLSASTQKAKRKHLEKDIEEVKEDIESELKDLDKI